MLFKTFTIGGLPASGGADQPEAGKRRPGLGIVEAKKRKSYLTPVPLKAGLETLRTQRKIRQD
jgi:hypothetical protein